MAADRATGTQDGQGTQGGPGPGGWRARVGQRVVVRRRLPDGSATDVVGELLAVDEEPAGWVLVVERPGAAVRVPLPDVLVGKVVPPRPSRPAPPHRALTIGDLERVAALHWRAPDAEPLGSGAGTWLLRAAGGFTGRANSALAAGDPGIELPAALAAVRAWYARRGLTPQIALPRPDPRAPGVPPPDAAVLEALAGAVSADGWVRRPGAGATVLTAATAALAGPAPAGPGRAELPIVLAAEPGHDWLALYHYRGQAVPPIGRRLLLSAPGQVFASVIDEGATVAVARGSLGGGWAGVTAVEVDPGYRRQGLAGALLARLAGWAATHGARSTYVQVGEDNEAALRLYLAAGLSVHHSYDYLVPA
jgi:GNAT superfamily N-acetyltransferase